MIKKILKKSLSILMSLVTLSAVTYADNTSKEIIKKEAFENSKRIKNFPHNLTTFNGLKQRYFNVCDFPDCYLIDNDPYNIFINYESKEGTKYRFKRINEFNAKKCKILNFNLHYLSCNTVKYILEDIKNCVNDLTKKGFKFLNFITGVGKHTLEEDLTQDGLTPLKDVVTSYFESINVQVNGIKENKGILGIDLENLKRVIDIKENVFKTWEEEN